jgi:serine/threonine protein kinase
MASSSSQSGSFWLKDEEDYDLKSDVGHGRFSTVWKAREKVTRRVLAVKVFRKDEEAVNEVYNRKLAGLEAVMLAAAHGGVSKPKSAFLPAAPLSFTSCLHLA